MKHVCEFWDCGRCYALEHIMANSENGDCNQPNSCPHYALNLRQGDYVLATKYGDGDPCDHFCIGFLTGILRKDQIRYDVVDSEGKLFRGNGFRRVEKITAEEGKEMLAIFPEISDKPGPSVWSHLERIRQGLHKINDQCKIPDPWFN